MKINKLFHWLYGALMCLPLLGVLFTSLYVTFNPNAKDSYYGETINDSESLTSTFNDLVLNVNYHYYNTGSSFLSTEIVDGILYVSDFIYVGDLSVNGTPSYSANDVNKIIFKFNPSYGYIYYQFLNTNYSGSYYSTSTRNFDFSFTLSSNIDTNNYVSSNLNSFYYLVYNKYSYLDNSFSYAINDINNNPLYNWAQDSFLVAPIAFVTGLFGLTQTSPVVTLLSYWLTISIVWLVFDLIMYIPLLVHRWLDKGVLS